MGEALTGLRGVLIVWVWLEHFLSSSTRAQLGHRMSVNTQLFAMLTGLALGGPAGLPLPLLLLVGC